MVSEHQQIDATANQYAPVPPPPSYEEVNESFSSQNDDAATDALRFFLGEVVLS